MTFNVAPKLSLRCLSASNETHHVDDVEHHEGALGAGEGSAHGAGFEYLRSIVKTETVKTRTKKRVRYNLTFEATGVDATSEQFLDPISNPNVPIGCR